MSADYIAANTKALPSNKSKAASTESDSSPSEPVAKSLSAEDAPSVCESSLADVANQASRPKSLSAEDVLDFWNTSLLLCTETALLATPNSWPDAAADGAKALAAGGLAKATGSVANEESSVEVENDSKPPAGDTG